MLDEKGEFKAPQAKLVVIEIKNQVARMCFGVILLIPLTGTFLNKVICPISKSHFPSIEFKSILGSNFKNQRMGLF